MILRRRTLLIGGASVVGGLALGSQAWPIGAGAANDADPDPAAPQSPATTETVTVERGDLIESIDRNGTVGFGQKSGLPIDANGIVTETRRSGDVVSPGDVIVRVADRPVTLAAGNLPLYRELRRVSSNERDAANERIGLQTGPDVEQLQRFLVSVGFDDGGRLEADGTFGLSTERAVKEWQRKTGHVATGRVDRKQLVFVSGSVRIESAPAVGQTFSEVQVTSGEPTITVTVPDARRSFFAVGTTVQLESRGQSATGRVTSQERTIADDGSTAYLIEIEFADGSDLAGAETAKVIAQKTSAADVLHVPVRALLALAEGGWAVQVDGPTGPTLTRVELGIVVDGHAEISGVDEGTRLVVPA